jgi:hypothetical protein
LSSSHKIRDGNEYPVDRVLARTSDYRIPKSVFGYSENFFLSVEMGHKDVTKVLLKAGASLSTVGKHVIKPPVKQRKSNIKPFK